jgi:antitoxin (DNA-binding transcriptional repressor) of toxin-antitoxin stability system
MKTVSQRELRNGSAALMDAVENGETFRITRHGVEVAELRPVPDDAFTSVVDLKRAFARFPSGGYPRLRAEEDAVFGEDRVVDRTSTDQ